MTYDYKKINEEWGNLIEQERLKLMTCFGIETLKKLEALAIVEIIMEDENEFDMIFFKSNGVMHTLQSNNWGTLYIYFDKNGHLLNVIEAKTLVFNFETLNKLFKGCKQPSSQLNNP